MAHSLSAKKRIRQNEKRRLRNRRRKSEIKQVVDKFNGELTHGQTDQAAESLKSVFKTLDKVAAKGTIHKKTAARRKSRLAKRLHKAAAGAKGD